MATAPGWQTDDLAEEWVEDESNVASATSSVSLTEALGSLDISQRDNQDDPDIWPEEEESEGPEGADDGGPRVVGTFVVREEVPAARLLPKTPGKAVGFANMFTPLALEKMFEPPSPPPAAAAFGGPSFSSRSPSPSPDPRLPTPPTTTNVPSIPSPLSQTHLPVPAVQVTPEGTFTHEATPEADTEPGIQPPSSQFTFTGPPRVTPSPNWVSSGALAQSTPGPSKLPGKTPLALRTPSHARNALIPPPTDPRLRLFQFQYDTFTREHLSAIVDSIAVGTPSASSHLSNQASSPSFVHGLSKVSEASDASSFMRMRAAKRIKLNPPGDSSAATSGAGSRDSYGEGAGAGAMISRPKLGGTPQPNVPQASRQANEAAANSRRDYVSESRSLMQQIKAARDFSTVSTVSLGGLVAEAGGDGLRRSVARSTLGPLARSTATAAPQRDRGPSLLPPDSTADGDTNAANKRPVSAMAYRQQAMDLIAQIRMGSKPMLSTGPDTTASFTSTKDGDVSPKMEKEASSSEGRFSRQSSTSAPTQISAASSLTRTNSASTIPGFVFTSRPATRAVAAPVAMPDAAPALGVGRPQQPRKRSRLSTEADDVIAHELSRRASELSNGVPPAAPEMPTVPRADSPSPTLSAFPLPPSISRTTSPSPLFPPPLAPLPAAPPPRSAFTAPSNPPRLPPGYPTASLRARANHDMNRFVSSASTATSAASGTSAATGTTALTALSSVGSYVKHAGPAVEVVDEELATRPRHAFTQIRPTDVPVPQRVGKMVYDPVRMVWMKENEAMERVPEEELEEDGTSEDPFRDIESLRDERSRSRSTASQSAVSWGFDTADDEDTARPTPVQQVPQLVEVVSDAEGGDVEEAELNSFSLDESGMGIVPVMTGVEDDDFDRTTDTDDDGDDFLEMTASSSTSTEAHDEVHHGDADPSSEVEPLIMRSPARSVASPVQQQQQQQQQQHQLQIPPTPVIKPALKSLSVTPISALKGPSRGRITTPQSKFSSAHKRSVSFSDGKREGPIAGVGKTGEGLDESGMSTDEENGPDALLVGLQASEPSSTSGFVPSARSKRIADALQGLGEPTFEDTPSKNSSGRSGMQELQPFAARYPMSAPLGAPNGATSASGSRRVFSRSNASLFQRGAQSSDTNGNGNATFLTECSFGVAHDKLVAVITDVQPFEPYWEDLAAIDLSGKKIESVARLKEFLPKLDSLVINSNGLSYLSGVPGTVRSLSVASNGLTSMTSFNHLINLENLDVSRNSLDSLRQLECLRHLRELRADGNKITSLDGLQKIDGLVKLSLQGNRVREIDLSNFQWPRLEMLNLSDNRVDTIAGLASLPALVALNLDQNSITSLSPGGTMAKLRILRLSGNKLHRLNAAPFPNLRTLYADNNSLVALDKANRLCKLENLSLRNQTGKGLVLSMRDIRDVKRLYLSGNPMGTSFMQEACYNLVYLELAACRLTSLPPNMGKMVPNLRVLNLNYNFLDDIRSLEGLSRLRKLTIIGSRMKGTKPLIRCVRGMPDIEMLDFRMNPCTLGWYLPLLVRDAPAALQPSEGKDTLGGAESGSDARRGGRVAAASWQELDAKFRRDLPDEAYVGRLAYRGLVMRACPLIRTLDGVEVGDKERDKATRLLAGIMSKRGQAEPTVGS